MRRAFEAMGGGTEQLFEELVRVNRGSISSKEAIHQFCQKNGYSKEILEAGIESLWDSLDREIPIERVAGALKLLDELQGVCPIALVTMGREAFQFEKMEKAGIQQGKFSKLIVGEGPSKKMDYQRVADAFGLPASEGIICGDRVPIDLSPGRELGMTTVHFRNGRGLVHNEPREDVDRSIDSLEEIQRLVAQRIV